jgi:Zn ribbon nucleic-acid-binding protein
MNTRERIEKLEAGIPCPTCTDGKPIVVYPGEAMADPRPCPACGHERMVIRIIYVDTMKKSPEPL